MKLKDYITEYVSSGRRKRNVSPKLSDLNIGDMVRIKSKKDILDMINFAANGEMRYYYDSGGYLYIANEMLEMCGDECKIIDKTFSAVRLYDKKFPKMKCFWAPELLEEI